MHYMLHKTSYMSKNAANFATYKKLPVNIPGFVLVVIINNVYIVEILTGIPFVMSVT